MTERQEPWGGRESPLTPDQCKRGRMLARWSIADLAGRSGVDPLTVQRFEAGEAPGVGFQLLAAFARHGLSRQDWMGTVRWVMEEGAPFNRSHDLNPHIGEQFQGEWWVRGQVPPTAAELEWPRSDDLPAELFERPVPAPYWANPDGNGPDPRWSGRMSAVDAEWVRRNPWAMERWPAVRVAMKMHEAG